MVGGGVSKDEKKYTRWDLNPRIETISELESDPLDRLGTCAIDMSQITLAVISIDVLFTIKQIVVQHHHEYNKI